MRFKHPDKSECSVEKLIIMDFYIITDITSYPVFIHFFSPAFCLIGSFDL